MTSAGAYGEPLGADLGDVSGGWGEAELTAEDSGELLPGGGEMALHNNRGTIKISPAQWTALLHHPAVVDAITQRALDICAAANSMVNLSPQTVARLEAEDPSGNPAYGITVQNRSGTTRARARVYPTSLKGAIDEATNCTLESAMGMSSSGPVFTGVGPARDEAGPPEGIPPSGPSSAGRSLSAAREADRAKGGS